MKPLLLAIVVIAACHAKEDPRCSAFADRVAACAMDPRITPPLSDDERASVREHGYAACAKTAKDDATLHYYGDVDRKIECMRGKDCAGVRVCLTADDARGSATPGR